MNLSGRLDKLERTESIGCVLIWQNHDDTPEAAIDRWRASRPGEHAPSNVTLIRWEAPQ